MAAARMTELQMPHRRWKDTGEISPERTKIWAEPPGNGNSKHKNPDRRVPVIYYISRNGQLEHPHFMEVPLSSPEGLYLQDVINRLNFLRGKGMASLYSWSSKRSYKNGYVWHDLSENDFIFPAHGNEYILKGSEILENATTLTSKPDETVTSSTPKLPAAAESRGDHEFQAAKAHRRRNQSWSSFDLQEYKVYAGDSISRTAAADAGTQTDDKRRRRRAIREIEEEAEDETEDKLKGGEANSHCRSASSEIIISSTDEISEISPPPSDSSPETLETLMKADGRLTLRAETAGKERTASSNNNNSNTNSSGRTKATSVLMQLLSCGSIGFRDCGPGKENGFSLISHYKVRLPRGGGGGGNNQVGKDASESESTAGSTSGYGGGMRVKLEEKEYFSGSFVETKKNEFPELKRSSSYNADRSSSKMETAEAQESNDHQGSRTKFKLLRKAKASSTKLERSSSEMSCSSKG